MDSEKEYNSYSKQVKKVINLLLNTNKEGDSSVDYKKDFINEACKIKNQIEVEKSAEKKKILEKKKKESDKESHSVNINEYKIEFSAGKYTSDYIYTTAKNKYGMDVYNVNKSLRLISYEAYRLDEKMDYYMACTVINHYITYPEKDLFRNWGGGDKSYNEDNLNLNERKIEKHAIIAFGKALDSLDKRAWSCHGVVPQNGYKDVQMLDEAIYVYHMNGKYGGIWDKKAKWYHLTKEEVQKYQESGYNPKTDNVTNDVVLNPEPSKTQPQTLENNSPENEKTEGGEAPSDNPETGTPTSPSPSGNEKSED